MSQITTRHSHADKEFPDRSRTVTGTELGKDTYKDALDVNVSNIGSLLTIVDEPDANTTYIGKSTPGSATGSAQWQIKKISVSGAVTTIAWADSNVFFDNIWTDRASLTYG